jgi:competence protein ComGC
MKDYTMVEMRDIILIGLIISVLFLGINVYFQGQYINNRAYENIAIMQTLNEYKVYNQKQIDTLTDSVIALKGQVNSRAWKELMKKPQAKKWRYK